MPEESQSADSPREGVLARQLKWAREHHLDVSDNGYLEDLTDNLFAPLSPAARAAFESASGRELIGEANRPAKMLALHSSSALAVNVFDFWAERDLNRILAALEVVGTAASLSFEEKLPTGMRGTPPNLDVVISLTDGRLAGIESKYTEWMTPRGGMAESLAAYCGEDTSSWSEAGLPQCHELVGRVNSAPTSFRWLDVPQLLKHALGLRRASAPGAALRYLYVDVPGAIADAHRQEVVQFSAAVGDEIGFKALTYQELLERIKPLDDREEVRYFSYIRDRYFAA
jgi:hypothetical protein